MNDLRLLYEAAIRFDRALDLTYRSQYLVESFGLALFPLADSGNAAAAVLHVAVRPTNKVHSLRITTLFACIGRSVSSQSQYFLSFDSSTHFDTYNRDSFAPWTVEYVTNKSN